jgi:hypothetical protein
MPLPAGPPLLERHPHKRAVLHERL